MANVKSSFYSTSGPDPDEVQTLADLIAQAEAAQAAAEAAQAAAELAETAAEAAQAAAEAAAAGVEDATSAVVVLNNVTGTDTIAGDGYVTQDAWVEGAIYVWLQADNNTGPATLSPDGLAAKDILKYSGALAADDLVAGTWYSAMNDGTDLQLILSGAML